MCPDKTELRKEIGLRLKRFDAAALEQRSKIAQSRLSDLLREMKIQTLIAYRARFNGEIDVLPALKSVLSPASIYVVSPEDREVSSSLRLFPVSEGCEPISLPSLGSVDVIVVPGLAFDQNCNRLGRGGGFYDRLLALPELKRALKLSVCLHDLILNAVPTEPHDIPVHVVITDQETYLNQNSEQLKTMR